MERPRPTANRKGRVRRRLFVPGLVVLVLLLAAWAASMWVMGYRKFWDDGSDLTVTLDRGEFCATTGGTYWGPGWAVLAPLDSPFPLARMSWWPYDGVIWRMNENGWDLRVPLWMPAMAGVAMAVPAFPAWRRDRVARRRRKRGMCVGCGYDMAGSAGRVCPECGTDDPAQRTRSAS